MIFFLFIGLASEYLEEQDPLFSSKSFLFPEYSTPKPVSSQASCPSLAGLMSRIVGTTGTFSKSAIVCNYWTYLEGPVKRRFTLS